MQTCGHKVKDKTFKQVKCVCIIPRHIHEIWAFTPLLLISKLYELWLLKPCPNDQQPWAPLISCLALWKLKKLMPTMLTGTVEVKLRSGRQRKLAERTAHRITIKMQIKTPVWLQKTFSWPWSGCALFYCTAKPDPIWPATKYWPSFFVILNQYLLKILKKCVIFDSLSYSQEHTFWPEVPKLLHATVSSLIT